VVFDPSGRIVSIYEGDWRDGKKKGSGVLKMASGCKYIGNYSKLMFRKLSQE